MDHISLTFSFDQINELLDFSPQEVVVNKAEASTVPATTDNKSGEPPPSKDNNGRKRKSSPSSIAFDDGGDDDIMKKRMIHRDVERRRRREMSGLCRSLRSELPIECLKGKRSAADLIHETVGYIKHKEMMIEKLKLKKQQLLQNPRSSGGGDCSTIMSPSRHRQTASVKVKTCKTGMEVDVNTPFTGGGVVNLSGVLSILSREGLSVVNCISTRVDERFLHSIGIQANKGQSARPVELQRKLTDFCNNRTLVG